DLILRIRCGRTWPVATKSRIVGCPSTAISSDRAITPPLRRQVAVFAETARPPCIRPLPPHLVNTSCDRKADAGAFLPTILKITARKISAGASGRSWIFLLTVVRPVIGRSVGGSKSKEEL